MSDQPHIGGGGMSREVLQASMRLFFGREGSAPAADGMEG